MGVVFIIEPTQLMSDTRTEPMGAGYMRQTEGQAVFVCFLEDSFQPECLLNANLDEQCCGTAVPTAVP